MASMDTMNGDDHGEHSSKVHFDTQQAEQPNSAIVVKRESDKVISVHLGFLQLNHVYEVTFSIKDDLDEDLLYDNLQNLRVRFTEVMPSEDGEGHDIRLELHAHKEKLMKEELTLVDSKDNTRRLTLILNARVLGKGKGTPSLKEGVRYTGMDLEEDSEASDWQGFE